MKIILDAMGGDNAPDAVVNGAVEALNHFDDISIVFSGKRTLIESILSKTTYDKMRIEIIDAPDVIGMDDAPAAAIRSKKDSSMVVGLNYLASGNGDIFISAGNTGALLAGSTLLVRRVKGIKRAPLVTQFPTKITGKSVLLVDAGANVDCKAEYLKQFAVMGSIYMSKMADIENPRVGLINNGSEAHKGNNLTKEAYDLLSNADINFVGNTEGRDILSGDFDVVVADGFTGNIILKFLEGVASLFMGELKQSIMSSFKAKIGYIFMKKSLGAFKRKFDYKEYGGALMLGLNKGVVKAHGSSDAKAMASAVAAARKFLLGDVVGEIKRELESESAK